MRSVNGFPVATARSVLILPMNGHRISVLFSLCYSSLSEEAGDAFLDKEIENGEIVKCVRKLKHNKTGGSDGIVGKLLKYGGSGMEDLLEQLFSVI